MSLSAQQLKARAIELGFNLVGLTPAIPSPRLDAYTRWIEAQMYGSMNYMARADRQARRRDLNLIVPGVRSILVVGLDYHALRPPDERLLTDPARGRIAAYAWRIDYHNLMTPRLEALAAWLQDTAGHPAACRVYVDTGAVLERSHAGQAGLGFTGKNTMLIHPRRGSYFFLGEVLTDMAFDPQEYDPPHRETMCGSCTRCQVACPTNAFPRPYVLDARRCISYLTIEHKGWIDRELRPQMGNWVFGCDLCQEACPFNRFAIPAADPAFREVDIDRAAPPLTDLIQLDERRFKALVGDSPIARIKRDRLVRNACIAAGNWGDEQAAPFLIDLLNDPNSLIRGHAVWALARTGSRFTRPALDSLLRKERDAQVQDEIRFALDGIGER